MCSHNNNYLNTHLYLYTWFYLILAAIPRGVQLLSPRHRRRKGGQEKPSRVRQKLNLAIDNVT